MRGTARPLGLPAHRGEVLLPWLAVPPWSTGATEAWADDGGAASTAAAEFVRPTDNAAPSLRPSLPPRPSVSLSLTLLPTQRPVVRTYISVWLREVNEPNVSAAMFSVFDGGDRLLRRSRRRHHRL